MSMLSVLMAAGNSLFGCDSADFLGTNDYMTRGAGLTGAADSKTGIVSVWIRLDAGTGLQRIFGASTSLAGACDRFRMSRASVSSVLQIIGNDAAGNADLQIATTSTFAAGASWIHFLASWDLATAAAGIYINDVLDYNSGAATLTDDNIDFTVADWGVGADPDATDDLDGCLAELYFAPGQYLDFSVEGNRRLFISAAGKPVFLGTDGSLPTGTAPIMYQRLAKGAAVATFATNLGSGGNLSVTGTIETGSTSPSD